MCKQHLRTKNFHFTRTPKKQKAFESISHTCCETVAHVLEAFSEKSCYGPFWTFWECFVNHFVRFESVL